MLLRSSKIPWNISRCPKLPCVFKHSAVFPSPPECSDAPAPFHRWVLRGRWRTGHRPLFLAAPAALYDFKMRERHSMNAVKLNTGDRIRLLPGTLFYSQQIAKDAVGTVIDVGALPGNPGMIRVDFPGLDHLAWYQSSLFMPAP